MLTLQHVCLFGRSLFSLTYLMLSDTNGNYNDHTTYTIYCRLLDVCQRVFSQDTGACSISDLPPYIFWSVLWTLWMLWTWRSEPKLEMFAKVPNPKSLIHVDSSMKTAESGSLFDILACPAFKPILGLSEIQYSYIHIFNYIHTFIMYVCMVSDVEHCGT